MTDNELIAEFMELTSPPNPNFKYWTQDGAMNAWQLRYNSSWNWLMQVVEKIKQLYNSEENLTISIPMLEQTIFKCGIISPIEVIYKSVVEFIKWYNTQKQPKEK